MRGSARRGRGRITDVFAPDMVWRIEGHSVASKQYANSQQFVDEVLAPFAARFAAGEPFRPIRIRSIHADAAVVASPDGLTHQARGTALRAESMRPLRATGLMIAGALTAVGLLGIMTIGLPLLLIAGLLLAALWLNGVSESDVALVLIGAAAGFVVFGIASLPYHPCRPGETLSDPPLPGQRSACGGTHPAIYFVPAVVALVGAVTSAVVARRPNRGASPTAR